MKAFGTQYRKQTRKGVNGNECCLCGRPTDETRFVVVGHDHTILQTSQGDDLGLHPIGPDCAKTLPAGYVQP